MAVEQIKRVSAEGDIDDRDRAPRSTASRACSAPRTPARGSPRSWRSARPGSAVDERRRRRRRAAGPARRRGRLGGRADRRGDLGAVGYPRLPLARDWAVDQGQPDGGRPHRRVPPRPGSGSGASTASASRRSSDKQPNRAHAALVALERDGLLDAVITQNIDRLHARAGTREPCRGARVDRPLVCLRLRSTVRIGRRARPPGGGRGRGAAVRLRRSRSSPEVVLFGEYLPVEALARAEAARRRGRPDAVHRLLARGLSGGRSCPTMTLAAGGQIAILTQGPTPLDRAGGGADGRRRRATSSRRVLAALGSDELQRRPGCLRRLRHRPGPERRLDPAERERRPPPAAVAPSGPRRRRLGRRGHAVAQAAQLARGARRAPARRGRAAARRARRRARPVPAARPRASRPWSRSRRARRASSSQASARSRPVSSAASRAWAAGAFAGAAAGARRRSARGRRSTARRRPARRRRSRGAPTSASGARRRGRAGRPWPAGTRAGRG